MGLAIGYLGLVGLVIEDRGMALYGQGVVGRVDCWLEYFRLGSTSHRLWISGRICQNCVPGTARPSSRLTALVLVTALGYWHTQLCFQLPAHNRARVPCIFPHGARVPHSFFGARDLYIFFVSLGLVFP